MRKGAAAGVGSLGRGVIRACAEGGFAERGVIRACAEGSVNRRSVATWAPVGRGEVLRCLIVRGRASYAGLSKLISSRKRDSRLGLPP